MSRVSIRRLSRKARILSVKLRRNADGVAAIEFGLIAPILLIMLLGTVEISRAVSMDRKFGLVTATVADLVAREKSLTAADVNGMYGVVQHLMKPWNTSTLKISIIPVKSSPTNGADTRVYAAAANRPTFNGAPQSGKCSTYTLTAGLLAPATSVIVVQTSYAFTPLFAGSLIGSSTWTEQAVLAPRNSCVDFDGTNCVSGCWNGG